MTKVISHGNEPDWSMLKRLYNEWELYSFGTNT